MRKKFKKMNLTEKKGYIKQKEFEMQRYDYERQILDLKKKADNHNGKAQGLHLTAESDSSVDERGNGGNDLRS